jgi:hypothetical protein
VIVSVVPANEVPKTVSERVAGPLTTPPPVLYWEPWQGQVYVLPEMVLTVQASWVQTAVSAENASCEIRATRKFPAVDCTSAAPPTVASGEPLSTVTAIVRPETVPLSDGRGVPPNPPLGEVGLSSPPHPWSAAATVTSDAAWQNSRRFTTPSLSKATHSVRAGTRAL